MKEHVLTMTTSAFSASGITGTSGICSALSRDLRASGDPDALARHVDALRDAINPRPTLSISRSRLCTRVGGFGDFDAFEHSTFLAASGQRAIVYVEVEEFKTTIPSVENIARVIYGMLRPRFQEQRAQLAAVTVWETPKTWCEYSED